MNKVAAESSAAAIIASAVGGVAASTARSVLGKRRRRSATGWLLAVLGLGLMVSAGVLLHPLQQQQPIHQVNVIGKFTNLDRGALRAVINQHLEGSWLTLAAADIRQSVLALPWVKQGSVRIVWPNTLEVEISERQAVARWGEGALLDSDGELFTPANIDQFSAWPRFDGPANSQRRLLSAWQRLQVAFEVFQVALRRLRLLESGEWQMLTDGGGLLITDSNDPASVVITYGNALINAFGAELAAVARIDFRYTNGFAVTYKAGKDKG